MMIASALRQLEIMLANLGRQDGIELKFSRAKPTTDGSIFSWEEATGVRLPSDYCTFLLQRGAMSLKWSFSERGPRGERRGGEVEFLPLPHRHPLRDRGVKEFRDLWLVTRGDLKQLAVRFINGEARFVIDSVADEPSLYCGPETFSEWLSAEAEWYFGTFPYSEALERNVPPKNGVRSLSSIEEHLLVESLGGERGPAVRPVLAAGGKRAEVRSRVEA